MQWSFTSARPLSPAAPGVLKRPLSSGSLAALAAQAKQPRLAAVAAAQQQPGGAAAASGEAPMAVDSAAGLPQDVDVAAVAAKHGWDITQQNHDWSGDRQARAAAGQLAPCSAVALPAAAARWRQPAAGGACALDSCRQCSAHHAPRLHAPPPPPQVRWLRVDEIRRPLQGSRSNDPEKVAALMQSIQEIGLQEPIGARAATGGGQGRACPHQRAHAR